ncbi:Fur family transcriptional regulator [Marinilactibacillus piezotolerans]|uniref:Fur family transcriptional regulator n=1 Tax=Marinilactibacillus piezotolerans TaxID=258723 RepID=UPI0009B15A7F|nr:transcriptional repressor [Marinilactibacillus piezotolerans]
MKRTDSKIKTITQTLYSAGFKLTPQRQVILKVLLENEHLSAEEIYLKVKIENSSVGLATVYRTLDLLRDLNVLNKMTFQDGISRYDLNNSGHLHQPHYLLCQKCGKIDEVENDLLLEIEKTIEELYHFKVNDHRLTFQGVCRSCLEQS